MWHDKRQLPPTRRVYAPSPFEQTQANARHDKSSAWKVSNKIDSSNSQLNCCFQPNNHNPATTNWIGYQENILHYGRGWKRTNNHRQQNGTDPHGFRNTEQGSMASPPPTFRTSELTNAGRQVWAENREHRNPPEQIWTTTNQLDPNERPASTETNSGEGGQNEMVRRRPPEKNGLRDDPEGWNRWSGENLSSHHHHSMTTWIWRRFGLVGRRKQRFGSEFVVRWQRF
jgi:hypothetical protein